MTACGWCGAEATDEPDPFFLEGIVEEDTLRLCPTCREKRWDEV